MLIANQLLPDACILHKIHGPGTSSDRIFQDRNHFQHYTGLEN